MARFLHFRPCVMQAEFRALYPFTTVSASALSEAYLHSSNVTIEHNQAKAIADSIEVDKDVVKDCFVIAKRMKALIPLFICRSNPLLQGIRRIQSIFFVPNQDRIAVFITVDEPAGYNTAQKKRVIRILHSFMLLFNAQGAFQQKVDTVSFLTQHVPTESSELSRPQQKVIMRLSNTQTLGHAEHVSECFAFIDYPRKNGERKIIYFQKRAYGDLRSYLQRNNHVFTQENSELVMLTIARKILRALIFMHLKGLLHKDIKCENVLLEEEPECTANPQPVVRITDFDRSCKFTDMNGRFRVEGTADWMAPEFSNHTPFMQGLEQEIWSTGLLLHILTEADGKAEVHKLREKKLQTAIDTLQWPDKIFNLRHVAQRMIQKDPQRRISFDEALSEVENLINLKKIESLQFEKA